MAKLADARDLKSREVNPSYRFEPGFRHHSVQLFIKTVLTIPLGCDTILRLTELSILYRRVEQLVARRAHNPEVVWFKSHPCTQRKKQSYDCFFLCYVDLHTVVGL